MDKFVDGQHFHGHGQVPPGQLGAGPQLLSELICGEMFRAAGVPASRCAHAIVTINGKPKGLYYLKEGYDIAFLKRHFGTKNGNFYDGGFLRDIDQPLQIISRKDDVEPTPTSKALLTPPRAPTPPSASRRSRSCSTWTGSSATWSWKS